MTPSQGRYPSCLLRSRSTCYSEMVQSEHELAPMSEGLLSIHEKIKWQSLGRSNASPHFLCCYYMSPHNDTLKLPVTFGTRAGTR